jgi:uncharacterized membrane protein YhaH (DUF805 family)
MLDASKAGGHMGFTDAIQSGFRHYTKFSGRASRSEYWWFALFYYLLSIGLALLDRGLALHGAMRPFAATMTLAFFLPNLSVTVRRLHDIERSGWLLLAFYAYCAASLIAGLLTGVVRLGGPARELMNFEALFLFALIGGVLAFTARIVVLTIRKGTAGPNKYGEDPLVPKIEVVS